MIPTGLPAELIPHMFGFVSCDVSYYTSNGEICQLLFSSFLFFMFPAEAVLLPCADALDVGTVHIDDHAAHDGRTGHADDEVAHGQPLEQAVEESQHRVGRGHDDAAQ